jgi:hypothetical protein
MANATLRIWWFTNYRANAGFGPLEIGLGLVTLPFWLIQGRRPQKAFGFGHASLHVPGAPSTYISWGGAVDVAGDTQNYGIQPEEVEIPLADADTPFGLRGAAIADWYRNDWSRNPSYNLATRNCCDCAVGALTMGGGLYYSPIGTKWLGYDGARTVLSWGQRIRDRVVEMNRNWQQHWVDAKAMIEEGRTTAGRVDVDDLHSILPPQAARAVGARVQQADRQKWWTVPTLTEWKKRSAVLVGARKEQVLKMDQLLQDYDGVRNTDPGLRDIRVFHRKASLLKTLVMWSADHLCSKRTSDRRGAVLPLASAAWAEHNRLAQDNCCGSNGAHLVWDLID